MNKQVRTAPGAPSSPPSACDDTGPAQRRAVQRARQTLRRRPRTLPRQPPPRLSLARPTPARLALQRPGSRLPAGHQLVWHPLRHRAPARDMGGHRCCGRPCTASRKRPLQRPAAPAAAAATAAAASTGTCLSPPRCPCCCGGSRAGRPTTLPAACMCGRHRCRRRWRWRCGCRCRRRRRRRRRPQAHRARAPEGPAAVPPGGWQWWWRGWDVVLVRRGQIPERCQQELCIDLLMPTSLMRQRPLKARREGNSRQGLCQKRPPLRQPGGTGTSQA
jgi:hypothetical protein